MAASFLPTPKEIRAIVEGELAGIGGRLADCDRQRASVYIRATVPHTRQVKPNDHVQGGVAVATVGREIRVRPYVFRQMSRSGAIMGQAVGTKRINRVEAGASNQTLSRLKNRLSKLIQECAAAETLSAVTDQLRIAAESRVDAALQMSAVISRIPRRHSSLLLSQIMSEFHEDDDTSVYALMNAVTAVARDETDPAVRWDLEELAGSVPALLPGDSTSLRRPTAVAVG